MFKKFGLETHTQFFVFLALVLLKFFVVRTLLFEGTGFFYTIFVEIGYLFFIFGLVELFPLYRLKKLLYVTINLVFSILLLAILIYHDYYGYIVTFQAFSQIDQVGTIKDSVLQLIDPIYLVLFADLILLTVLALVRKKAQLIENRERTLKFILPVMIVGIALLAFNIFTQKDTVIADTVLAAEKQGILTYEILSAKTVAASATALTDAEQEITPDLVHELKEIVHLPKEDLKLNGIAKDKNIIVIQAEAFQDFTLNLEIDGQEVTPFLNELLKESLYFPNVYQQIGQGNTSDAEFLFNTSLYPAPWTATSETFGDREIPSFPRLLKEQGYKSLTFHANDVTFWNRDEMYPALGFDQFYDINFFGNFGHEDVIGMGPSDEYVYNMALPELKELHEQNQKFYAQFVTLSSHHPFIIPGNHDVIKLPEKFDGTLVGSYLKAINYTDQALEQLVNALKKEGMWEDTILVFYGDHFGLQPSGLSELDFEVLEAAIGHEYTQLDQFNIPFIVTVGGQNISEENVAIGGQIDMMPTVANLLDLSLENQVIFGQDLVNYYDNLFGMRYYMPNGAFFNKDIAFRPEEGFTDGEALDIYLRDPIEDFSRYEEDYNRVLKLMQLSDQYMKSLPQREL
ncbi:LTA synthase family protein [Bacillus sp. Marseille-P3661]|uniref:LTA synthase family protein n=1 Tax=Bacillus sp. Marseille-P3661 TaxID=1936234 RepID=UPI000C81956F|nr:LTA synthase family protein [Bacillus sp. Marseille-P3661]